jgi:uncharacterized protein (DUF1684 family)
MRSQITAMRLSKTTHRAWMAPRALPLRARGGWVSLEMAPPWSLHKTSREKHREPGTPNRNSEARCGPLGQVLALSLRTMLVVLTRRAFCECLAPGSCSRAAAQRPPPFGTHGRFRELLSCP